MFASPGSRAPRFGVVRSRPMCGVTCENLCLSGTAPMFGVPTNPPVIGGTSEKVRARLPEFGEALVIC